MSEGEEREEGEREGVSHGLRESQGGHDWGGFFELSPCAKFKRKYIVLVKIICII